MIMNREEIKERVIQILWNQTGVEKEKIEDKQSIRDDLDADSLDIIEIIISAEEEFDIEIPDEEAEKVETVGQMIDYIQKVV